MPPQHHIVISADCHAVAQPSELARRIDLRFRDEFMTAMRAFEQASSDPKSAIFSQEFTAEFTKNNQVTGSSSFTSTSGQWDSQQRTDELEADGVVAEVIFPNGHLFTPFGALPSADMQISLEHAYNAWIAEFCAALPGRRAGLGVVNLHDLEGALREIRYIERAGLRGVVIPIVPPHGQPPYYHSQYAPIWGACEHAGLPIHVHGGASDPTYCPGAAGAITFLTEVSYRAQRPLWWLIWGGVFEQYPRLRFVMAETLCFWLPGMLDYLDNLYKSRVGSDIRRTLRQKPSEYWRRQCMVISSPMRKMDAMLRHRIGVDNMMWGSDYPHIEGTWPKSIASIGAAFEGIPRDEAAAILGGNAARLYGFAPARLCDVAQRTCPTLDSVFSGVRATA
jgi:predicted TIM-barrel fold metal-dependent hydrolase